MHDSIMPTYARLPVSFERGEGPWLWDSEGDRYFDAISGIAVCSIGHAHPQVAKAISDQASRLLHTSNLYSIPAQQQLADNLTRLAGMQQVFFGNSGAEANEAAIKIARLFGHNNGIDNPTIIVADGSFHGRTMATLSATGNPKVQDGFAPLLEGFVRVPYDDIAAIEAVANNNPNIVAVLFEPVQGEGGVNIPSSDFLGKLRTICDRHNWLMMLDEVQTGMCRTGEWFAFQHSDITPDVMTLAKALGNGVPIGACLTHGKATGVMGAGNHASTFGGNPLVCQAALAVIDVMTKSDAKQRAEQGSQRIVDGLQAELGAVAGIIDIRHHGMMIGIQLGRPCAALVKQALAQKLLINVTAGNVIRLLPVLLLSDSEIEQLITDVSTLVKSFLR
ncbi:MAG: aspartate aminotransferase family protein [Gammaproteobacteria bacterium]|nr:aspartate aminotransferase family protein [Gammaproteobacteria bacterium]MCF6230623.1 aspartate aminotransferase family protein [Gammaproteobacteria bacterium]